ncbi:MAG: CRISPR-associated helicase Cas3' [Bacteroidetes bacterium]|jgi:CRISPR-associated endonuclease/helicase Cas3|nr:CRISPR-associated helicase Cas3' [Bacteroidota bacterium]
MHGPPKPHQFWAKLKYKDDDRSTGIITGWHPLVAHSADVAAVTEALLTRTLLGDRLARLAGWDDLTDVHIARLAALAAIHDAGKVNQGFQNRAFGKKPEADHVTPVLNLLESDDPPAWLDRMGVIEMLPWVDDQETLFHILLATWGHHGEPVAPASHNGVLWEATSDRNPVAALKRLAQAVRTWFPLAFREDAPPFPGAPPFQHAYNGVLTLADWIGSDSDRFFPFADPGDSFIDQARCRAERAIRTLFLEADATRNVLADPVGFDRVLEQPDWSPHPIQQATLDLPLQDTGSLTILESDTGSGKTEAALARFMRLFQAGHVDAMYFAVPTRSAATQLHGRIDEAVQRIFGDAARRPPVVQAVPGYIKVDSDEATHLPNFEVRWDEDNDALRYRGWAAESPKRYLAGPIVVGTVDQVLLSTLQVRHAHLRGAALLRHFLVVDEVHASDVYMAALLDRVLNQHLQADGHAFLMSATLGADARTHLATNGRQDPPPPDEAEANDYPLLTHVDAARRAPTYVHAASVDNEKTVHLDVRTVADDASAVADLAARYAEHGARVLVIRNLVKDCIETQHALEERLEPARCFSVEGIRVPHHSRFAATDRTALDTAIESTFGKGTPQRGLVAVATQTVEQSLDIDADILLTDLCPMDVLLQRIGRLHRHHRARPDEFAEACCVVLTPETRDLSTAIDREGKGIKGPHGLGTVYPDLRMLEATWQVLAAGDPHPWRIPAHNRVLVERATHPNRLHALVEAAASDAWTRHERWILGQRMADAQHSDLVSIDYDTPFGDEANLFPDDAGHIMTRLGVEDYRILLPEPLPGPLGTAIQALTIPAWQFDSPPDTEEAHTATAEHGGFRFTAADCSFVYDRFGLRRKG